jgi:hypothetical protein
MHKQQKLMIGHWLTKTKYAKKMTKILEKRKTKNTTYLKEWNLRKPYKGKRKTKKMKAKARAQYIKRKRKAKQNRK